MLYKFVDAVIKPEVRQAFVSMPSDQEMGENIWVVWEKYKLPNVISGTDWCHFSFREKPRGVPDDQDPDQFMNRIGFYSINAMITGGINRKIYDIVLSAPGSYTDAAVWSLSRAKAWLETRFPRRYTLVDSAYPQSLVMMTPYPANQAWRLHS